MQVIVKHKQSGKKLLLIGSGFSADIKKPSFFTGKGSNTYHDMLCCINKAGEIGWVKSNDLEVVSVNGQSVDTLDID